MHRVGTRSVAIAGGFTEQSANPTRLHGNETELVQKQTSLFPFLALGSSSWVGSLLCTALSLQVATRAYPPA